MKRFFGAVRPGAPAPEDEAWAESQLLDGERAVWAMMNNPDRRHAVAVARDVVATFAATAADPGADTAPGTQGGADRAVVAAALLHDSGKVLSGMRTPSRVFATVFWAVADDSLADDWLEAHSGGARLRLAQYRRHPELGAEMLRAAGSDPLTYSWAAEHHRPPEKWSVALDIGMVLKDCDDD